ncbi:LysR family transcriptional regulator [Kluyvera genomosp. 1]|uniref:LysR family transcriptional regulator n=1 Tax=Kluyvera genomosp. 1 TaxID=2774053 RepID=UPI00068BC884|nr:LysR family transcriptional regulator [Kluyvera genomosp. 1]
MDKIHAMQLFIRVAELESFTRAADTLGLPKGSVSRQIQALENHLGCRLLHRTTRRVLLTQDGMVYYERAKDLLSNLDELDSMFQSDPSSISGRLRVDMPVAVARHVVIPKLPDFLQHYPGIELELSSSDRLVDVIREGFDCVVRVGTLKDSGLIARPLGKLTVINCASPTYLSRFGYPESLDDLSSHALVHYATNIGVRPPGFEVARENGTQWVKAGGVLTVNSTETYHAACLAGLGIIQAPRVGVREALHNGKLVEILPQYRGAPMPVSLLYPHRRNLSRRVHLFMEWLTEVLQDYVD